MLKVMPEELLKMFNMDIVDIDTVFGWFKTEGYTFITLFTCLYSAILGSNILLKEESDKTIEFLHSKPITRSNIISAKIWCGLINILIMFTVITIFNIIGMSISNNLEIKLFLLLSLTPLSALPFSLSACIFQPFSKTSTTNSIGIGFVFVSYFLQIISAISDKVDFIKYTSVFTLSDGRNIIINNSLNYLAILISITVVSISCYGIYRRYNNKELV